jgi:phosphomannomutase
MVKATVEAVKAAGADVGVMFDTDVDRSGLIDGKTLLPLNEDRLIAAGLKPTERAEQVSLEGFCNLARQMQRI